MTLPQEDSGLFEKIDFLDLDRDEAEKLVAKYNEEGEAYKKKMDEKYGSQKSSKRDSRYIKSNITTVRISPGPSNYEDNYFRSNNRDNNSQYSTPPPVVYSNGAAPGAHGSGANNEQNTAAWQEYYKKYYEYYGQYPQGNISFSGSLVPYGLMVI